MRVGKSEVDLHVQFDDQEGPPRSQIIEETAKPRKKLNRVRNTQMQRSPSDSEFSLIQPAVSIRPNYADIQVEKSFVKPKKSRKRSSELQSSDEEYTPSPRAKRPSRKAGKAAKIATKLIADALQIETQEARTVSPKSRQVGRTVAGKRKKSLPAKRKQQELEQDVPKISLLSKRVPQKLSTDESLNRRQSDLFDAACGKAPILPKPGRFRLMSKLSQELTEDLTPVEKNKQVSNQDAPKRPAAMASKGERKVARPAVKQQKPVSSQNASKRSETSNVDRKNAENFQSKVRVIDGELVAENSALVPGLIIEIIHQASGKTPTINVFGTEDCIENRLQELREQKRKTESCLRSIEAGKRFRRNVAEGLADLAKAVFEN